MVPGKTQMVGDLAGLCVYAGSRCAENSSRGGYAARNAQSDGLSGQAHSIERGCVYNMSACVCNNYEEVGEASHAAP